MPQEFPAPVKFDRNLSPGIRGGGAVAAGNGAGAEPRLTGLTVESLHDLLHEFCLDILRGKSVVQGYFYLLTRKMTIGIINKVFLWGCLLWLEKNHLQKKDMHRAKFAGCTTRQLKVKFAPRLGSL